MKKLLFIAICIIFTFFFNFSKLIAQNFTAEVLSYKDTIFTYKDSYVLFRIINHTDSLIKISSNSRIYARVIIEKDKSIDTIIIKTGRIIDHNSIIYLNPKDTFVSKYSIEMHKDISKGLGTTYTKFYWNINELNPSFTDPESNWIKQYFKEIPQ